MLVKTDELTGDALCFVVAKLNGYHYFPNGAALYVHRDTGEWYRSGGYRPDINWAQAGPIIEWMVSGPGFQLDGRPDWMPHAQCDYCQMSGTYKVNASGPTGLIAAMRCFVALKLGQLVEVPDELLA